MYHNVPSKVVGGDQAVIVCEPMVMEKSISIQKIDLRKINNRNTNKIKNRGLMRLSIDFDYTNRFSTEKKKNIRSI